MKSRLCVPKDFQHCRTVHFMKHWVSSAGHRDARVAQPHEHSGQYCRDWQKNHSGSGASACASRWRLPSKCRRHFGNSGTKFKCWQLVWRRWKHSCNSNQPELSMLSKKEAHWFRVWEQCERTVAGPWSIRRGSDGPFTLKGTADQNFDVWTQNVRTFMLGRFGDHILGALTWASRQRKIVDKGCGPSQRNRMIPWIHVFGEGGDEEDQIDEIDDFVVKLYAYLVSFTNDAANRIVRNSGEGSLETSAQRVRPDTVLETRDDTATSSEPTALSASRGSENCSGRLAH